MTAKEIREGHCCTTTNILLREIAAQLAELTEWLRSRPAGIQPFETVVPAHQPEKGLPSLT